MQVKSKGNKETLVEPDDTLPEFVGSQSDKTNESKEKSSKELYPVYNKKLQNELCNHFIQLVVYFLVAQKLNLQYCQGSFTLSMGIILFC